MTNLISEARTLLTARQQEEETQRQAIREAERAAGQKTHEAKAGALKILDELADLPQAQVMLTGNGGNPIARIERYHSRNPTFFAYLHLDWANGKEQDAADNGFVQFHMVDHKHKTLFVAGSLTEFRTKMVQLTADHLLEP